MKLPICNFPYCRLKVTTRKTKKGKTIHKKRCSFHMNVNMESFVS